MRQDDVESDRRYFRSETRVFNLNGLWHFSTREGDQGPFVSRKVAEQEALRYANERQALCRFQESREAENVVQRVPRRSVGVGLSILPMEETAPLRGNLALEPD